MPDTASLADAVARHAVPLLVAASLVALIVSRLAWHAIERHAPVVRRLGSPLWRRVDRGNRVARLLGLEGTISFLVAGGCTVAFVELADAIDAGEDLAGFDIALAAALREHLSPGILAFFARLTHLGDFAVLVTFASAASIALAMRREWLVAVAVPVVAGGAGALNETLKQLFARARPDFLHELVQAPGYSFPSGHAAGSLALYGLAAYLAVRRLPHRWHMPIAGLAMLLIVFVGASRVLLQVHYLSDVLAGWLGATVWTALCVAVLESLRLAKVRRDAP